MTVIIKAIKAFDTIQINNVSNIDLTGTTFTITHAGGTATYSSLNYRVFII